MPPHAVRAARTTKTQARISVMVPVSSVDSGRPKLNSPALMASYLFSSESVTEGHPDKLCDAVSDAVLDACLAQDPHSRVACETATKTGFVMLLGEITTKANLDYPKIARDAIREIGFTSSDMGFDADSCAVMVAVAQPGIVQWPAAPL